jgi:hypothetical protein
MPSNENTRVSEGRKIPAELTPKNTRNARIDAHAINTTEAAIVNSRGRGKGSAIAVLNSTAGGRYRASAHRLIKPANTPPTKEPIKEITNEFIRALAA